MKLVSVSAFPTQYQVAMYRELAARLGDGFLALFADHGHARPQWDPNWGVEVSNESGLLEGYPNRVLARRRGSGGQERWRRWTCPELPGLLRELRPDAVLVSELRALLTVQAVRSAGAAGARRLLRSSPYDLAPGPLARRAARWAYHRAAYRFFDAFCATGTLPRRHYERFSGRPGDVHFSPYCLDEFFLLPLVRERAALRAGLRARLGVAPDELLLLFCGRLAPVKRVDWVIEAALELAASRPAKLLLVGHGPLAGEVERAVARRPDRLRWVGHQPRRGVAEALAAADLLLLPSLSETWAVVVNEAIAFQLPVVASDRVNAAPDLILPGRTGFTFPVDDRAAFAARVGEACERVRAGGFEPGPFLALQRRFSAARAAEGVLTAAAGLPPRWD